MKDFLERVDKPVLISSTIILVTIFSWAFIDPEGMNSAMDMIYGFATTGYGWLYLLMGFGFLMFCLWLAFGRFGEVKLGGDNEKPKYSYFSWFAMMFACGYGAGLVFWGVAEPLTFLEAGVLGSEPMTAQAAEKALAQAFFHWGWTPWAIFLTMGVVSAYFMYRKGATPHFSSYLKPLFGEKVNNNKLFRVWDGFIVFGVVAGATTTVGLGMLQLSGGLNMILGVPETKFTLLVIGIIWTLIFTLSAVSGIDKGIKFLSDINIPLCILVCVLVLLIGPTIFILNTTTSAFGEMTSNFLNMSFWTDSIGGSGFPQSWTVFYLAWWIANCPPTGVFIATISKGRTIKEMVLAHLGIAPLATWLWFGTFGSTAIDMQLNQGIDLVGAMAEQGTDKIAFTFLQNLPFGTVLGVLFLILIVIFMATTVNSFVFVCAQVSTKRDKDPINPPKIGTAIWGTAIGVLATLFIIMGDGNIDALRLLPVAASVPTILFLGLICVAMIKSLNEDFEKPKSRLKIKEDATNQ